MHRSKQLKLFDRFVGAGEQEMRHFVMAAGARAPSSRSFGAVHDGHERSEFGRMQASPAIAVARDQVIDRVADHPWDELDDPCPL
jgi:hypothetical protein